jgi:hypothetical protein
MAVNSFAYSNHDWNAYTFLPICAHAHTRTLPTQIKLHSVIKVLAQRIYVYNTHHCTCSCMHICACMFVLAPHKKASTYTRTNTHTCTHILTHLTHKHLQAQSNSSPAFAMDNGGAVLTSWHLLGQSLHSKLGQTTGEGVLCR